MEQRSEKAKLATEQKEKTNTTMTYRLFEGKDHACIYQKYRFMPPDEVKNVILQYLDKKVCHGQKYCEYRVHSVFIAHIGPFDKTFCL